MPWRDHCIIHGLGCTAESHCAVLLQQQCEGSEHRALDEVRVRCQNRLNIGVCKPRGAREFQLENCSRRPEKQHSGKGLSGLTQ